MLGLRLEKADLMHLAQTGLFGLIGLLALLLVLRPMVLRLTTLAPAAWSAAPASWRWRCAGAWRLRGAVCWPRRPRRAGAAPARRADRRLLEDESMVNIAQIEGQMRASSLRRITELVDKHPDETLSIVRGWMVRRVADG